MKAIVHHEYGSADVLHLQEVPKPAPKADQILVKIYATTVNRTDTGLRSCEYFISRLFTGLFKPKFQIWGSEFAGVVVEVGQSVQKFKIGNEVFGLSADTFGAHAEYLAVSENGSVAHKPRNLSFAEAAAICEGPYLALNYLEKVKLGPQHQILINGASGSIGSSGVQLAKYFGAAVTAVTDTKNGALARSLGADVVIDYTQEDFTQRAHRFDFVFDAVGKSSFFKCKPLLKPNGVYFSTELGYLSQNVYLPLFTKQIIFPIPKDTQQQIELFKEMAEAGQLRAVIDRTYTLEDTAQAHRYVEKGMKVGSVVVRVV
ncbi:MAG: NAD(P)-dependent alcohol dehydrogenase [Runella slithyformis]|nr:MAG: NAD(P)-dependent alcohol dehydrogenase [Runella slithyformis]TAF25510.1 MAG: NAD(P)-dependent alcohol dehydrogenase [Runella slithyformis]TAF43870.1 MAG: NAD(P)-dependent alcohol dehydrogenase [Runella slithyformis]